METRKFIVPRIGDGTMASPYRPKYSDEWLIRTGHGASVQDEGSDWFIARFPNGTDEDYGWLESHEDVEKIDGE